MRTIWKLALFLSPFLAQAKTEQLQFRYLEIFSEPDACQMAIDNIAVQFENATGHSVKGAYCVTNRWEKKLLDGIVTYSANEPVAITTYGDNGSYQTVDPFIYANKEECLEDAAASQNDIFITQTGTKYLTSYCYRDSNDLNPKWGLQIFGLGLSDIKHFLSGIDVTGVVEGGWEVLLDQIPPSFSNRPQHLAKVSMASKSFWYNLRLSYYAEEKIHLANDRTVNFKEMDDCLAALDRSSPKFKMLSNPPIAMVCTSDQGMAGIELNIINVGRRILTSDAYEVQNMPGVFKTKEDCEVERLEVIDKLNNAGTPATDVFCSYEEKQFYVIAYIPL